MCVRIEWTKQAYLFCSWMCVCTEGNIPLFVSNCLSPQPSCAINRDLHGCGVCVLAAVQNKLCRLIWPLFQIATIWKGPALSPLRTGKTYAEIILNLTEHASRPITYDAHLMQPSPLPWTSCQMPWTNSASSQGVMQFGGEFSIDGTKHVVKRKADNQLPRLVISIRLWCRYILCIL